MILSELFLAIGILLFLGYMTDALGERTPLPRVTLLLLLGLLIGPSVLNLLPERSHQWFPFIFHIALVMVGFLLGEKLTAKRLQNSGRLVLSISISVVITTAALVTLGLVLIGVKPEVALLLGAIATATAPAATLDVVEQTGAKGRFSDTLLGIVAVDDAWGLILFGLLLTMIQFWVNGNIEQTTVWHGLWELSGSVLLGVVLGFLMVLVTGRFSKGKPKLYEVLAFVFLCAGAALWLEVSYLLAAVVMGAVVANFARHYEYAFHSIEGIEKPFMILFFILAGASLEVTALTALGLIGVVYMLTRMLGRIAGAHIGCRIAKPADPGFAMSMGLALMPQAGVAMGMALAVEQKLPDAAKVILPVVIATTVLFEIFGPIMTRYALRKSGETSGS